MGAVCTLGASCGVFWMQVRQLRAKPACVWAWQSADKKGAKVCLPAGSTAVPWPPQYVICPKGLAFAMQLGNADASVTNVAVGSGSSAMLSNVVGAGQTIKSVAVTVV